MGLTDEQIAAIMQKHITCKTLLVQPDEVDKIVEEHTSQGWKVANKVDCNGRVKITFKKVESINAK